MTEIVIDIYGNEAEISSFTPGSTELSLVFTKQIEGFIGIGNKSFAIANGKCLLKLNQIEDGEYTPNVITRYGFLRLPRIVKEGNRVYPKPCDDDFIRNLSKRERMLCERVKALEKTVELLTKSVYGTKLF